MIVVRRHLVAKISRLRRNLRRYENTAMGFHLTPRKIKIARELDDALRELAILDTYPVSK